LCSAQRSARSGAEWLAPPRIFLAFFFAAPRVSSAA
jgi:hypothetical protein